MRKIIFGFGFLLASLVFATSALAASLTVTSIGVLDTSGTFYSHWWYTSENPQLSGTAEANSTVTIDIDGAGDNTTADSAGLWTYSPTTLTNGDHLVTIISGTETVAFTLTIGSTVPADTGTTATNSATTPDTLPDSGIGNVTWLLVFAGLGTILVGGGSYAFSREKSSN